VTGRKAALPDRGLPEIELSQVIVIEEADIREESTVSRGGNR
jgi:hypothetical protein